MLTCYNFKVSNNANDLEVWLKPILPEVGNDRSAAVAFVNRRVDGIARDITLNLRADGLNHAQGYQVKELFDGQDLGVYTPDMNLTVRVNPTGIFI